MTQTTERKPKLTPMMEQYCSIKKTLPRDTVLFYRLGDFYEMFFEDAVRSSEILNITLTGREGGEAGRIPMCGIPFHSAQGYIRTLVDQNLKVAICEQVGDPKASKGLVERKITRVISPATYLEDEGSGRRAHYLAALCRHEGAAALAYLELSTGEFFVRPVPRDRLEGELGVLAPREVILSATDGADEKLVYFVKEVLGAGLTVYEDWIFEAAEGMTRLRDVFHLATDRAIPFHEDAPAVGSCGAVLYYLDDHLHKELNHVSLPVFLDTSEFMGLERTAQKSLELVETMSGKRGSGTLLATVDQTLTSMGARALYHWMTHPLLAISEIERRQTAVEELCKDHAQLDAIRELLKGVKDVERTITRLNCGVANARDLVNLKIFLERIPDLRMRVERAKSEILVDMLDVLRPFQEVIDLIGRAIVEEPPLTLREGGMIRDGYCAELDELHGLSRQGKSWILEFQKREIERTGIKNLKIKYSSVFGYMIEVTKSYQNLVPEDYLRKQTLANAERYIVPELKSWDEKISGAQDKIKALEYKLFNDVRVRILEDMTPLQAMAKAIGSLDALCGLAFTARVKQWVRPRMVDSGELMIEGGRHPVVEAMLPAGRFVENDTFLDHADNQLVILTGPNMAGKSTYIRQVGLMVILAQIGSFVPARSARIGVVDRIFTRIGASDDLAAGESTFMVEMVETAAILRKATSRSLLILDEVGRGTSTFDGVSIAWAICEFLCEGAMRPRTLFATHYHELTQLEDHFPNVKNYNITVKERSNDILFLRKVVRGGSDRSYGIHVARLAGIPEQVTRRARRILDVLESESTEATQIIEGKLDKSSNRKEREQPTLFDWAQQNHPILDEIRSLAVDGMTPLEALNRLSELKQRLAAEKEGGLS